MTAETLVVEARRNREEAVSGSVNVHDALTLLLGIVLESCEYEREMSSTPAVVARALALLIASIEDSGGEDDDDSGEEWKT